jgi:hypothetical protein
MGACNGAFVSPGESVGPRARLAAGYHGKVLIQFAWETFQQVSPLMVWAS